MKHLKKVPIRSFIALVAIALSFTACQKPKPTSPATNTNPCVGCTPVNKYPSVYAGPDQTIKLPLDSVVLDGSTSYSVVGKIVKWEWRRADGPGTCVINSPNSSKTVVKFTGQGVYQFELKATNDSNYASTDVVRIVVLPVNVPNPPDPPDPPGPPLVDSNKIFIAGVSRGLSGVGIAKVWNGGTSQSLTNGQYDAQANAVFVAVGSVYAVGWEKNASNKRVAKLWKNNIAQNLSDGHFDANANDVFVYNGDVYVVGWEMNENNKSVAKLWKNGVSQSLSNGQKDAVANSVYVSNGDVYVAGFDFRSPSYDVLSSSGMLWKNGQAQAVGNSFEANVVRVSGTDVYVAGFRKDSGGPGIWKNGVSQSLVGGALNYVESPLSMCIFGSEVHFIGNIFSYTGGCSLGEYWRNGLLVKETNCALFSSILVAGSSVYIVGNNGNSAMLWKNNVAYKINGLTEATSVFVTN